MAEAGIDIVADDDQAGTLRQNSSRWCVDCVHVAVVAGDDAERGIGILVEARMKAAR